MKLTAMALACAFALSSTSAFAHTVRHVGPIVVLRRRSLHPNDNFSGERRVAAGAPPMVPSSPQAPAVGESANAGGTDAADAHTPPSTARPRRNAPRQRPGLE